MKQATDGVGLVPAPALPDHGNNAVVLLGRTAIPALVPIDQVPEAQQQPNHAAMVSLHALVGHYARQYEDCQAARIAQENRVRAMVQDGIAEAAQVAAQAALTGLRSIEAALLAALVQQVAMHPLASWVQAQPGIALPSLGRLLGITGPLSNYATPAKLWKYLGLHVTPAGTAPRRTKGMAWTHTDCGFHHPLRCKPGCQREHHKDCTPDSLGTAYSPAGRTLAYLLGLNLVRNGQGGTYRAAYETKKAEYLARPRTGASACPFGQVHGPTGKPAKCGLAHANNAAMRYAAKLLVRDLWRAYQAATGAVVA